MIEATIQNVSDFFQTIRADNMELAKTIPIDEPVQILMQNPDDLEGAFTVIRHWIEEHWVPLILDQSQEAQAHAIDAATSWGG